MYTCTYMIICIYISIYAYIDIGVFYFISYWLSLFVSFGAFPFFLPPIAVRFPSCPCPFLSVFHVLVRAGPLLKSLCQSGSGVARLCPARSVLSRAPVHPHPIFHMAWPERGGSGRIVAKAPPTTVSGALCKRPNGGDLAGSAAARPASPYPEVGSTPSLG